ncbi:STAS domain-containing protein [Blautia schinkii]|nr:STAS domain-containing protein [Blautia schinkii]
MTINKIKNDNELTVLLEGRLDTTTAPELETELRQNMEGIECLILDMEELVYLSSAGLRVILGAQKQMNKQGKLLVRHVNDTIMEVFEVTGFTDILTIEN